MDLCADFEATKAGSSSVQDKISSKESDSEATKARMRSIESELGITSKTVVGNTSHPHLELCDGVVRVGSLCLTHPELVFKHPTHLASSVLVWFV